MKPREFYDNVKKMRELQKEYFKTRDKNILSESILQEKIVDDEINRVEAILNKIK